MAEHELKTWPEYYDAVREGRKPFEYRKNDRDFQVGDVLVLRAWSPAANEYIGGVPPLRRRVTYAMTDGFDLPPGYCILGLDSDDATARGLADGESRVLAMLRERAVPLTGAAHASYIEREMAAPAQPPPTREEPRSFEDAEWPEDEGVMPKTWPKGWFTSRCDWDCCREPGHIIKHGEPFFATGARGVVFCEKHAPPAEQGACERCRGYGFYYVAIGTPRNVAPDPTKVTCDDCEGTGRKR